MNTQTMAREPVLLTPEEVARDYLRCSRSKIYELLRGGGIPGVIRIGGSVRINRSMLVAWITERSGQTIT